MDLSSMTGFLEYQALYDPHTFLFLVAGVLGGFYIWGNVARS
jgi:hypothetical protein